MSGRKLFPTTQCKWVTQRLTVFVFFHLTSLNGWSVNGKMGKIQDTTSAEHPAFQFFCYPTQSCHKKKTFVWNNTFSCHFAVRFCLVHWYSKEFSFESHFGMFFLSVLFSSAAVFQTSRVNSLVLQKNLPHWLVVRCLAYSLVFICSVSGILSCLCEDNIQGLFLLKAVHSEVLIILGELTL